MSPVRISREPLVICPLRWLRVRGIVYCYRQTDTTPSVEAVRRQSMSG